MILNLCVDAKKLIQPLSIQPEAMDGAIVAVTVYLLCKEQPTFTKTTQLSTNSTSVTVRTSTLGCVITNENVYLADKERSSNMTAKLVEFLVLMLLSFLRRFW